MSKRFLPAHFLCFGCILHFIFSCSSNNAPPSEALIKGMELKRGPVISCGSGKQGYGSASMATSCGKEIGEAFNTGLTMLHSFEYDEAEKVFSKNY